jgi:hypothetical protein
MDYEYAVRMMNPYADQVLCQVQLNELAADRWRLVCADQGFLFLERAITAESENPDSDTTQVPAGERPALAADPPAALKVAASAESRRGKHRRHA